MAKAFRSFPEVYNFCVVIHSLRTATIIISVVSVLRGLLVTSYILAPQCKGMRAMTGAGFAFVLFEGYQFAMGLFLLIASLFLGISTCVSSPHVKTYIIAVYITSSTAVFYSLIHFFFLATKNFKCDMVFFDKGLKILHPGGELGYFGHVLMQIIWGAILIYFTLVVNSYARQFDTSFAEYSDEATDPLPSPLAPPPSTRASASPSTLRRACLSFLLRNPFVLKPKPLH